MNRIEELFKVKKDKVLSVYFTAGFPKLNDTALICKALQNAGVDMIEIGVPFSDPVADGETIQQSNELALQNGMSLELLLTQLSEIRKSCTLPIILMGYLNPFLQYGLERFCDKCSQLSIDGTIIPDLPLELYMDKYKACFEKNNLLNIFLITPQTDVERIRLIDRSSRGFIYAVSSSAVTGGTSANQDRSAYLDKLKSMKLTNPLLVGFGISSKKDFSDVCEFASGAIIGSAFIRKIQENGNLEDNIFNYINSITK